MSCIIVRGAFSSSTLCDSHCLSPNLHHPSHLPFNPVSCLAPTLLLMSTPNQSSNHRLFRYFSLFALSQSLHLPSRLLPLCQSIVEETVAETNRERSYSLVCHKIGERKCQRDNGGEEDTQADMRAELITDDCQLEGKAMWLFAFRRYPKNITHSHHAYPLQPQDRSSHQPSMVGERPSRVCKHWLI